MHVSGSKIALDIHRALQWKSVLYDRSTWLFLSQRFTSIDKFFHRHVIDCLSKVEVNYEIIVCPFGLKKKNFNEDKKPFIISNTFIYLFV